MPWPEICQKPFQKHFWKFDLQNHPVTNICCQREWDEISHVSRLKLTFMLLELDFFITLIASIGALEAVGLSGGQIPNFTQIFNSPEGAGIALLIFLAVPLIILVVQLVYEALIGVAEDHEKNTMLRTVIYIFFWLSILAIFLCILALLIALGVTNREPVIQVAAVIFAVRLFINWLIWTPIILTILYCVRKYGGRERTSLEEPRKCPGILCCKWESDHHGESKTPK